MMTERVIDAHCLVGIDDWLSKNKTELAHVNMLDAYEREMQLLAGDYQSIIMPFPSSQDGSYIRENDIVLQLHRQKPWTKPVLAFNCNSKENFDYICEKLGAGMAGGIVIWPILCNLDLLEVSRNPYFKYITEHYDCWVTVHVGAGNEQDIRRVEQLNRYCPEDALALAKEHPEVRFNLAHLLRLSEWALVQAEAMDNIVIDISGISTHKRWFECGTNVFPAEDSGELGALSSEEVLHRLMNREGLKDKLVFGTQYPFGRWYGFGVREELELVHKAGLTDEQQKALLYRNFERFLLRDAHEKEN